MLKESQMTREVALESQLSGSSSCEKKPRFVVYSRLAVILVATKTSVRDKSTSIGIKRISILPLEVIKTVRVVFSLMFVSLKACR